MREDSWSTSRRTFVKCGAVTTGTLFGAAGASAATEPNSTDFDGESADYGLIRPYQLVPGTRFTIVESGLDWQPDQFENTYQTSVIAYDHAPSFRAFLFTASNAPLESGRSFEFGSVQGSSGVAAGPLVTVGLE